MVRCGNRLGWAGLGWDGMGWDGMGWDVTVTYYTSTGSCFPRAVPGARVMRITYSDPEVANGPEYAILMTRTPAITRGKQLPVDM